MIKPVSLLTGIIIFMSYSFNSNASTLVKTNTFLIDETTSSGVGFGVNAFYMPDKTLVDVSLTIDATLTYDYVQYISVPRTGTGIPVLPILYYDHIETLTIDDPFDNLFDPLVINSSSQFKSCDGVYSISTDSYNYTCSFSGTETFTSVPVNITGIVPDDFLGFDVINFSAVSSFQDPVLLPINGILGGSSREFEWSGNYTFTYTYVPVPPAVWLFGSGLIGLIGVARRKKA
jgi:hypothetical protein